MPALRFLTFALGWLLLGGMAGAQPIPPKPVRYFNDYAGVVSSAVADQLDGQLEQFERDTSSQVVAVVFRKLPDRMTIEDFAVRAFKEWKIGQQAKDNGVALFVFVDDHKLRIEVGYGLEGTLPDALAKRIIEDEITPRFRAGDYNGGLTAGVEAILKATRGEYQGTGRTVAGSQNRNLPNIGFVLVVFLFVGFWLLLGFIRRLTGGTTYYGSGRRGYSSWGGWGGGSSGGGWSSGGGGWSGGGGFSGGGGSSGGGGASGSW